MRVLWQMTVLRSGAVCCSVLQRFGWEVMWVRSQKNECTMMWIVTVNESFTWLGLDLHSHVLWYSQFDRKNPPPPGGFSIYYVPWSRAVCKRFHDEMRRSRLVVKSLTHGSWSGNHSTQKPPPRGGGSCDQIAGRVAQNLEIIAETVSTNQNSAHGIYD